MSKILGAVHYELFVFSPETVFYIDIIKKKIVKTNVLNYLEHMTSEEVMILKNKLREIIFEHRYYSSSWRVDEEILEAYEELLNKISIEIPEYDYSIYL